MYEFSHLYHSLREELTIHIGEECTSILGDLFSYEWSIFIYSYIVIGESLWLSHSYTKDHILYITYDLVYICIYGKKTYPKGLRITRRWESIRMTEHSMKKGKE